MKKPLLLRAVRTLLASALVLEVMLSTACSRREVSIVTNEFNRTEAVVPNPMKGFGVFYGETGSCPEASIEYIGLKFDGICTYENSQCGLDTVEFDEMLSKTAERCHSAVVRVYMLDPGSVSDTSTGLFLPEALCGELKADGDIYTDKTAAGTLEYPDFNSEKLISCLTDFIRLFGKKYDGHSAIAAIQIGLYGSWGEWNMSGCSNTGCVMTNENLSRIISEYIHSFRTTKLMGRNPSLGYAHEFPIGYHDDNFLFNTSDFHKISPEWKALLRQQHNSYATLQQFYDFINGDGGRYEPLWDAWKTQMFGAELSMQLYLEPFGPLWSGTELEALEYAVNQFHITWMMGFGQGDIPDRNTEEYQNYRKVAAGFGYDLYIDSVIGKNRTSKIRTSFGNDGIAPFYYDWQIEYQVRDSQNSIAFSWRDTDFRLSELLPGESAESVFFIPEELSAGEYTVYLRFVNPAELISRNVMPLRLSNDNELFNGLYELAKVTVQ